MTLRSVAEVTEQVAVLAAEMEFCGAGSEDLAGLISAHQALCWFLGRGEDHDCSPVEFNVSPLVAS